jgi:large repetitive protein
MQFKGLFLVIFILLFFARNSWGQLPALTFGNSGNASGCAPHTVVFNISNVSGNVPGTTYVLDFGDGTPVINYTQATIPTSVSHTYTSISCGQSYGGQPNCFGAILTATNSSGPTIGTVTPIRISKKPNASFTLSPTPICSGGTITFTNISDPGVTYSSGNCNTSPLYYWAITGPSTGIVTSGTLGSNGSSPANINAWSTGSSPLTMQFTTPGSYQMKLSIGNSCGIDDTTLNFCVVAQPQPQFSVNPNSGCYPPSLNVAATNSTVIPANACFTTAYAYNWSVTPSIGWAFNGPGTATSINSGFTFSAAGTYTVTLAASVNNLAGCTATTTQQVTISQAPTVNAGADFSICASAVPIQLNGSPSGGAWAGTGVSSTGLYTPPSNSGTATLTYTLPSSSTCPSQSDQLIVTINPKPTVSILPATPNICNGSSVSLTASSSITSSTFSWSPSNGLSSSTGATVSANPSATTTYTVTGTAPSTGCNNTVSVLVTVNPNPTVSVPTPASICAGNSTALTATGAGGLGPYTYAWSPALGLSSTSGASVTASPTITSSYSVVVTDSRGCTGNATVTVTVNPIPVVNAGPDVSICSGSGANTLTGFSPAAGTWTGTGVTSTGVFTPSGLGNITLTYSVTQNGCTGTDQLIVNVINPTTANAGVDQGICLNANAISLTGTPSGGNWSGGSLVSQTGVFTPSSAGTHTLTYTFGSGSCTATDQVVITVYALPTVSVNDPTICAGIQATLTAVGSNGLAPYFYAWSPTAGLSASNVAIVNVSPTASTTYTVTITDAHSCSASDVSSITVNPIPIVNAGPDVGVCNTPNSFTLTGFSPIGGNWMGTGVTPAGVYTPSGPAQITLTYSFTQNGCTGSDDIVLNVTNPTPANAGTDQNICLNAPAISLSGIPIGGSWSGTGVTNQGVFTPSTLGISTLTYSFGTGNCQVSDQVDIHVLALPSVSVSPISFCTGLSGTLQAVGSGGAGTYTYLWAPSSGLSATTGVSVIADSTLSGTYTATITDANSCSSSFQVAVTVNPLPIIEAGPDLTVCNTATLTQLSGFSPANGTWTGTGVSANGGFLPSGTGSSVLTYSFTDGNGCINQDSLTISIIDPRNVEAGLNDSICLGAPLLQLSGSPSGGEWSGSSLVNSNGGFTPSDVGLFNLYYTVGQGTCAITDSLIITTLALPEITGQGATICANDTIALSVSATSGTGSYSFSWTPTESLTSSTGASVNAFPITNQDYSVTITDVAGCTDQLTLSVIVNQLPVVDAGSDLIVCFTSIPTLLTGESPSGGTWIGSGVSNNEFIPPIAGSQTIYYTYTEPSSGCTALDSIQITANNPDVVNAGNDTSVCVTYDAFLLTGESPLNGEWTGDNQVSSQGVFTANQIGSVTLIYTTGTGTCAVSDERIIDVLPLPIVEAGLDTSVCVNSLPFNFSGESPTSLGTLNWSGEGISDGQIGTFNPLSIPAGIYTSVYEYTESSSGCINSDSLTITVNALTPVQVVSDLLDVCLTPFNTMLTASPVGGIWTGSDINFLFNSDAIQDTAGFVPTVNGSFEAFYTYSDANQCINADTVHITVASPIDADAGPDLSFCYSLTDTAYLVGLPANGTWTDSQNPTWLGADGTVLLSQADTSNVIFTIGSGSCQAWDTAQVVIFPLPFIEAGVDTFRCLDDPCFQLLPPLPSGGLWSGNGISNSNGLFCSQFAGEGLFSINYAIDTIYNYQNLQSTCHNEDSLNVLVVPMPVPGLTIDPVLCINVDYILGNQSSGPASDFEWIIVEQTLNDTVFYSNDSAPTINLPTPGNYQLTLNSISPYGCSVSTSSNFIVVEPPIPQFSISDDLACAPYQGSILNNSLGYNLTYNWDFGPLFPSTSAITPPLPLFPSPVLGDSLFYVELSLTNLCGTRTYQDSITIRPLPIAVITTDYSIGCSPTKIVFQNISYGSPESFLWDFDNGITSTDSLPAPLLFQAVDFPQVYNVSVLVTNTCGSSIDTVSVTIYPTSFSLGPIVPQVECAPYEFVFQSPSSGQTFYLWDFGDGEGAIGESVSHLYAEAGSFIVQLTVSNFCFSDTVFSTLQLLEGPSLDFTMSASSICENNIISLNNTSSNSTGFSWLINGISLTSYTSPFVQSFSDDGNYMIGLAGSNANSGCTDTLEVPLSVISRPTINITADPDTGCAPLMAHFINSTQNATAYEWSFSNGTGSSQAEPSLLIAGLGSFTAQLIAHNYQSSLIDCPDTANVTVWVNPTPLSLFALSAHAGCGPPASVQTINQSANNLTYQWSWDGQLSSLSEPQITFSDTGLHPIILRVTNQYQCSDTSSRSYNVIGQPEIAFNLLPVEGCAPLSVNFLNLTQYGDSVSWGFGDGNFSSLPEIQHIYQEPGLYAVELFVSSGNGLCYDDTLASQAVWVHPVANSKFTIAPAIISQVEPMIILSNQSSGYNTLGFYIDTVWLSDVLPTSYMFDDPDSGIVRLTLVANNEFGCPDTSMQDVYIKSAPSYYFPNSFSPNNDGKNDVYRIHFDRAPTYYHVEIYDRWGHRVFESFDYEEGWNGTYKNRGEEPIKSDVYVLKFSAIFEGTIKINDLYKNINVIH